MEVRLVLGLAVFIVALLSIALPPLAYVTSPRRYSSAEWLWRALQGVPALPPMDMGSVKRLGEKRVLHGVSNIVIDAVSSAISVESGSSVCYLYRGSSRVEISGGSASLYIRSGKLLAELANVSTLTVHGRSSAVALEGLGVGSLVLDLSSSIARVEDVVVARNLSAELFNSLLRGRLRLERGVGRVSLDLTNSMLVLELSLPPGTGVDVVEKGFFGCSTRIDAPSCGPGLQCIVIELTCRSSVVDIEAASE